MTDARDPQAEGHLPTNERNYTVSAQEDHSREAISTHTSNLIYKTHITFREAASTMPLSRMQSAPFEVPGWQGLPSVHASPPTQIRLDVTSPSTPFPGNIVGANDLDDFMLSSNCFSPHVVGDTKHSFYSTGAEMVPSNLSAYQSADRSPFSNDSPSEILETPEPRPISFSDTFQAFASLPQPALPLPSSNATIYRVPSAVPAATQATDVEYNELGTDASSYIYEPYSHHPEVLQVAFADNARKRLSIGRRACEDNSSKNIDPKARKSKCARCDATYTGKWASRNLTRHEKQKHGAGVGIIRCEVCRSAFKRKDALIKHERSKHPELGRRDAIRRLKPAV